MKKIYITPVMEVIHMQTTIILAGSIDGSTDGNIKLPINIDDIEEEGFAD